MLGFTDSSACISSELNSVAGKEKGLFCEEMISIGIGSYHDRPELNLLYVLGSRDGYKKPENALAGNDF